MKKVIGLFIFLSISLAAVSVFALPFTETYSTEQKKGQEVSNGQSYNFEFDMWFKNDHIDSSLPEKRDTDSNLDLTHESTGAQGTYASATLVIDFYRPKKKKPENVDITLTAFGLDGHETYFGLPFQLDQSHRHRRRYQYTYDLNDEQLDLFDESGWANINIASNDNQSGANFFIQQVSLFVETGEQTSLQTTPVPEPATMILLSIGLGGVAIMRRRKRKA